MATTDSRVRGGKITFKVGAATAEDFSAQAVALAIEPSVDETDPIEVLDGTKIPGTSTNTDELTFTVISDHASADGLIAYSWINRGVEVDYEAQFDDAAGNVWTGKCVMQALTVGGAVGEQLQIDGALKITAVTPPTGWTAPLAAPAKK